MRRPVYEVVVGESFPSLGIWMNVNGSLLSGPDYTYSMTVRDPTDTNDLFVKTSGFIGQQGTGRPGDGTPNLVVDWDTSGELSLLTPGRTHDAYLTYTRLSDGKIGYFPFAIRGIDKA